MSNPISDIDFLIRILLSLILGSVIGLERQFKNRHAGIRTFAILSLGTTFITILSMIVTKTFETGNMPQAIAVVVISVGIIGAGVIHKEKDKNGMIIIRGLTTVTTLLITSVIGLAIGLGLIKYALIVWFLTIISLFLLRKVEIKTGLKKEIYFQKNNQNQ